MPDEPISLFLVSDQLSISPLPIFTMTTFMRGISELPEELEYYHQIDLGLEFENYPPYWQRYILSTAMVSFVSN